MSQVNVEDQVTYLALKSLKDKDKSDQTAFWQMLKKVNQVDPASSHLVADTLRLDDIDHNQFINCRINLQNNVKPVPDQNSFKSNQWITDLGKLELKRLIFDYQK